jgi:tripartite-type tricarboxylate transporter receptor subunit TctC
VDRLSREIVCIVQLPDVRERLIATGTQPAPGGPQELAKHIRTEVARWGAVVARAGIHLD